MAIDLNTKTYGEQFNAFVNFASKNRNLGNVARIGETRAGTDLLGKNGEPRTIVAKDWDGSGQFWRFSSSRKVNNEVRDLFLKTILSVCSVDKIEELPQNVQDVLKAEDFNGKGRPLTVLSMGMSDDMAEAISAGSTEVRIGTAIFGARQYHV